MILADRVWGVLLLGFGSAVAAIARTFPQIPGQAYGAALLPTLIGIGLVSCGLILLIHDLRREPRPPLLALAASARTRARLLDVGCVLAAVAGYILIADRLGFLLTAALLVGGLIWRFRRGGLSFALIIGALVALAVDWLFRKLLLVPLPLGPLAAWIW